MDQQMGEGGIMLLELDIVYLGMRVAVVNASHVKLGSPPCIHQGIE